MAIRWTCVSSFCVLLGLTVADASHISPHGAAQAQQPDEAVVLCHDPERDIVQEKLRHRCEGRIVTAAEASQIEHQRRKDKLKAFERQRERDAKPQDGPSTRYGTAFPIGDEGFFLTALHVAGGCDRLALESGAGDGVSKEAAVIASEASMDAALLKAEGLRVPPLRMSDRTPAPDLSVFTLGYPEEGLVRIVPRRVDGAVADFEGPDPLLGLIPAALPVRGGNSGGPLLDSDGQVLGMIVAQVNTPGVFRRTGELMPDLALAVPLQLLRAFLDDNGYKQALPPSERQREPAVVSVYRVVCETGT